MPIRIRCLDKPRDRAQPTEDKGLRHLRQSLQWCVMRAGNQNSACYADKSNYCYLTNEFYDEV